jgi:two-component system, cell cycle sensor histidine kinase and response regulator CckA
MREASGKPSVELAHDREIARLAAIVDSSDDAIISKSMDGIIETWNAGAEVLYGYMAQEVIGRPMSHLLPKNLLEEEQLILSKVRRGERVQNFETVRIHKEGRPVQVSLTVSPVRDASGEIVGVSHVARNITETKQLREKLQVTQKMEALGRLAGGVAHDFNNLLTIITGYGALLQASLKEDAERREMVEEIMGAAERAADLTRQLLVFSRRQRTRLEPVNLNEVIVKNQTMLRRLIGEDVEIKTQLDPSLERVRADSGQISQILMNLAANARDAMPRGGTISIQTGNWIIENDEYHQELGFAPGRYVRLLFSDTGHGMDARTRSRLFEPFFTTKEVGRGTGLGLATVYGIVKQSGGQISVYSEPGRGTTFAIYLPVTGLMDQQAPEQARAEARGGRETILLVEDEPSLRNLARSILSANGYNVLVAGNAEEALSKTHAHQGLIHLILTDLVMPGMDGQALAAEISTERPDIHIVFMSGYSDHAILERVLSMPGTAFLQKPFTPSALLEKVREVLDSRHQAEADEAS